jgi:hypothetical protein
VPWSCPAGGAALDAEGRVDVDPALPQPPADRLAHHREFAVDGIGVRLVRAGGGELGQHLRHAEVVQRGELQRGRLRPAPGRSRRGRLASIQSRFVSEIR